MTVELEREPNAEVKKFTNWKKEPSLLDLKSDLAIANEARQPHLEKVQRWNDLYYVTGTALPKTRKNRSNIQPKLIRKQVEWRMSALTEPFHSSNKLFNVNPVTFEDAQAAKQCSLLLNWQYRTKIDRISLIDNITRNLCIDGTVVVRVGWKQLIDKETVEVPLWQYFPVMYEEEMQQLQEAIEYSHSNPRMFKQEVDEALQAAVAYTEESGIPVLAQQIGVTQETRDVVIDNHPTAEVVSLSNIYVDPTCQGDYDKALFIVNSYEVTKDEITRMGGDLTNLDKINWDTDLNTQDDEDHFTTTPKESNLKGSGRTRKIAYDYWGYYDINDNGVLEPIVVTWIGNQVIRMEKNPYPDGKPPFVIIPYTPIKNSFYGEPDAELLEDNQRTIGAITRGIQDVLARSANSQIGIAKGMLDTINRGKFNNEDDYEYNPTMHPNNGIINHVYPEIPPSALAILDRQNIEAEALTGTKAFSGGISGNAYGDVATGIRGALDAASKREMAILRREANGLKKIAMKQIGMNAAFLTKEETIRVTNFDFVTITIDDIKGNFDLEVDIATAEIDDAKAQDLGFLVQTTAPNMDPSTRNLLMAEIVDLKKMPEFAERIRNQPTGPSPEEQQMMQLEMEKLQLENEELKSKIQLNLAKANEADSKSMASDLSTEEQASGVKHARDMEKQKAQAEGNKELEITKSLLNEGKDSPQGKNNVSSDTVDSILGSITPTTSTERDAWAEMNPVFSLGSSKFDPKKDPSLNHSLKPL